MKGIGFIDRSIVYLPFGFRLLFQVIVSLVVGILEVLYFTRTGDTAYFILSLIPIALSAWFARYTVVVLILILFASLSLFLVFSIPGARLETGAVILGFIYHAVYLLVGVGSCLLIKLYVSLRSEYAIREHTEKELETERNRLRVTLLSICDGIITTGEDERIIFLNQEGERLTGWREEDARGRHITEVYTILSERTREKITNPIQRIVERGYVIGLANHTLLVSKSGKEIPIGDSGAPIRDSDGKTTGFIIVFRDVSQNKVIQTKLKEAQAKVFQFEKLASIGQLAAGVAHEINNPLGYISSNFETMSRYVSSFKRIIEIFRTTGDSKEIAGEWETLKIDTIIDDIDPIIEENREGIRKIVEIVKNLKDFARTNREGKWEKADLNSIIGKVLIVLANEIKYSATLELDLQENLPGIYCMIDEIGQTILNLSINALYAIKKKFAPDLGTITVSTRAEGKNVACIVRDNGSGIPENTLPKIFEPFFTTKPPKEGSGLGLYLAYDTIVLKHKGDISVESKEGIGTTFTIRIPIHDEQNEIAE